MHKFLSFGLFFVFSIQLKAQQANEPDTAAVKTIDGIVNEVLRLTTREKGRKPDLNRFRNLFLPTARFTVLNHGGPFPEPAETVTLDEFMEILQDPYYDEGFIEYELGKVVDEYNGIAQVFQSVYQKDSEGEEGRAVNSYHLIFFDGRWWIANLIWTSDSNGVEVPEKYLKN